MKRSLEKKPKLLYMITKANWGGAQKYVFELVTNPMIRKDFAVSVVTGNEGELNERLKQKGIPTTFLPIKNSYNPFTTIFLISKMAVNGL